MFEMVIGALGLIGALVITGTYVALEREKISSRSPRYYMLNATGAVLIMVSIAADFDVGDMGGVLVEVLWLGVSLMGLAKALRREKAAVL
jgi:hypothetical protein